VSIGDEERARRIGSAILKEMLTGEMGWWWLSFVDPDTGRFRGAVLVQAWGFATAMGETHRLGINPGGAVLGEPAPDWVDVPVEFANRLLAREDIPKLEELFAGMDPRRS
jgi:hypothetical protein